MTLKIVDDPTVYVVGRQEVDEHALDDFLTDHGVSGWETDTERGGEKLSEVAGRVCYMSFAKPRPGGNTAYLTHIKEVGHGSVTEHAVWNLLVTGVSRSLTHELVRHRAGWAYSQLSQRYVDESVAECVVPTDLRAEVAAAEGFEGWVSGYRETARVDQEAAVAAFWSNHPDRSRELVAAGLRWLAAMRETAAHYKFLTDYLFEKQIRAAGADATARSQEQKTAFRKAARQAARSVLPNATETKIFVTANARALRHFIELRASVHAEPEIRKLAGAIWTVMVKEAPNLFSDYQKTLLPDGTFALKTPYPKV